jgi:uncharacterized tellurite resistance protein B-like protein
MLGTLRDLFESLRPAPAGASPAAADHALHLATAVLLVEVMRADAEFTDAERRAVLDGLGDAFALADDERARLLELAEVEAARATDFFGFTSVLNDRFDPGEKVRMVEAMWRVAYADGTLAAHENHLMRRAVDLLHVAHGDAMAAKRRARGDA